LSALFSQELRLSSACRVAVLYIVRRLGLQGLNESTGIDSHRRPQRRKTMKTTISVAVAARRSATTSSYSHSISAAVYPDWRMRRRKRRRGRRMKRKRKMRDEGE
jgi:uncharacterized metal-binding protein